MTARAPRNMYPTFAQFPAEIAQEIFLYLDVHTLIRCRFVCALFNNIIERDSRLLYRIELYATGMTDIPSAPARTAERLEALREHERRRRRRDQDDDNDDDGDWSRCAEWLCTIPIGKGGRWYYAAGFLVTTRVGSTEVAVWDLWQEPGEEWLEGEDSLWQEVEQARQLPDEDYEENEDDGDDEDDEDGEDDEAGLGGCRRLDSYEDEDDYDDYDNIEDEDEEEDSEDDSETDSGPNTREGFYNFYTSAASGAGVHSLEEEDPDYEGPSEYIIPPTHEYEEIVEAFIDPSQDLLLTIHGNTRLVDDDLAPWLELRASSLWMGHPHPLSSLPVLPLRLEWSDGDETKPIWSTTNVTYDFNGKYLALMQHYIPPRQTAGEGHRCWQHSANKMARITIYDWEKGLVVKMIDGPFYDCLFLNDEYILLTSFTSNKRNGSAFIALDVFHVDDGGLAESTGVVDSVPLLSLHYPHLSQSGSEAEDIIMDSCILNGKGQLTRKPTGRGHPFHPRDDGIISLWIICESLGKAEGFGLSSVVGKLEIITMADYIKYLPSGCKPTSTVVLPPGWWKEISIGYLNDWAYAHGSRVILHTRQWVGPLSCRWRIFDFDRRFAREHNSTFGFRDKVGQLYPPWLKDDDVPPHNMPYAAHTVHLPTSFGLSNNRLVFDSDFILLNSSVRLPGKNNYRKLVEIYRWKF